MAVKTPEQLFQETIRGAQPDSGLLQAWPTLSLAARWLSKQTSTLTRAMKSEGVTAHLLGRRDKKIAPTAVLHYARIYGADLDAIAGALLEYATDSGAAPRFVDSVEADVAAWMEGRARAAQVHDDAPSLDDLVDAINQLASPEQAKAILEAAGIKG